MTKKAAVYAREHASTTSPKITALYGEKFANLVQAIYQLQTLQEQDPVLVVAFPGVLGDDFDEVMQSLSLLAEAEVILAIVSPQPGARSLKEFLTEG